MIGALSDENKDALSVGEVLCDKWRIVRLIGRGRRMSAVYEAKDRVRFDSCDQGVEHGLCAAVTGARTNFCEKGWSPTASDTRTRCTSSSRSRRRKAGCCW